MRRIIAALVTGACILSGPVVTGLAGGLDLRGAGYSEQQAKSIGCYRHGIGGDLERAGLELAYRINR